ncbi:hypothetical protein [Amycolatopsis regifaucium]|nr:hypothetical protein [Amycolatopsis regifaucium]SFI67479.1 hypothetical protein SAMN04489731_112124 [Amycolatopsis regifaucium]
MATVVMSLWVTPESGGLKPGVLATSGVPWQVEAGIRAVIGGCRVGAKV